MSVFTGYNTNDPSHISSLKVSYDETKNISCPEWVDKEKFNSIFDRLTNPDVNSNASFRGKTLKVINQNQNDLENKSLLYFGAGADLEHPLIATKANKMTFIDSSINFKVDINTTENKIKDIINNNSYLLKVNKSEDNSEAHYSVVDKKTDQVVFSLDYYNTGYDSFTKKAIKENNFFDIVMDKDSWLLEWDRAHQEEKFLKIGSIIKSGGVWIGGLDTRGAEESFPRAKIALNSLFDRATDIFAKAVGPKSLEWSGYENLEVRIRTQNKVTEVRKELETIRDDDFIPEKLRNKLTQQELYEIRTNLKLTQDIFNDFGGRIGESLLAQLKGDYGFGKSLCYLLVFDRLKDDEKRNELIDDIADCFADFVQKKWNAAPQKDFEFDKQKFKEEIKDIVIEGLS